MPKKYKNAPIIEALCEFQFNADVPWDITLTGLIYERLKVLFPKKQQLQHNIALAVASGTSTSSGNPLLIPLVRFSGKDETRLVQLGYNLLTVNQLKPYNSWLEFLPLIESVFKTYLEIAKPIGFQHIAIRYINLIEMPKVDSTLENILRLRPMIPAELIQNPEGFLMAVDLPFEDTKDILHIQVGTATLEAPGTTALRLEISYVFAKPENISLEEVFNKLNLAHSHVEEAFELCLTDEIKRTFNEVTE